MIGEDDEGLLVEFPPFNPQWAELREIMEEWQRRIIAAFTYPQG